MVLDERGQQLGAELFWHDSITKTALVEPIRTEDDCQRRGLAPQVLTTGIDRLPRAGSERIEICFEAEKAAARNLYLDVGFEPVDQTDIWAGPTATG